MRASGVSWDLVNRHLNTVHFGRAYVLAGRRLRAATERVRVEQAAGVPLEASFCRFMDTVAPGWRRGR